MNIEEWVELVERQLRQFSGIDFKEKVKGERIKECVHCITTADKKNICAITGELCNGENFEGLWFETKGDFEK